jgi:hypothetical protein
LRWGKGEERRKRGSGDIIGMVIEIWEVSSREKKTVC